MSTATCSKRSREPSEEPSRKLSKDSVYQSIKQRSINNHRLFGQTLKVSARTILPLFKSPTNFVFQFIFPDNEFCTPFYCDFSHSLNEGQCLAVGDEDGRLSLLRTDKDNNFTNIDYHRSFYCHKHAISDVKWSMDDTMLVTASHDRSVRLWDTETRSSLAEFTGHGDLVKSVNWHPTNEHLIVTGSKDGSFKIWDTRFNQVPAEDPEDYTRIPTYNSIKQVAAAHSDKSSKLKPTTNGTKRTSNKVVEPLVIRSVTCAMFLNSEEEKIISSGSWDGSIKLWDIRAGRTEKVLQSTVFESATGGKRHGITDLKIDQSGKRLFSSCMDNSIYMHYLTDLSKPAMRYSDPHYKVGSFDIRIALSPDDHFLLSGSYDKDVFVWEVDKPLLNAYKYEGHTKKVTGVAWNKQNLNQFATCSEDFTTRIWNLDYESRNA